MDDQMLEYLREEEIVEPETTVEEAQRFLEHHVKAEECFEVYTVLRAAAQSAGDDARKKKKAKA